MHTWDEKDMSVPRCRDRYEAQRTYKKVITNLPTFVMYALGAFILSYLGIVHVVAYLVYCALSTLWYMRFICAYCAYFDRMNCPSGYTAVASRLFKRRDARQFKRMFRRHIGVLFPSWIVPVVVGAYLLMDHVDLLLLVPLMVFIIDAFAILPLINRIYACGNCKLKDSCPWVVSCGR